MRWILQVKPPLAELPEATNDILMADRSCDYSSLLSADAHSSKWPAGFVDILVIHTCGQLLH